MYCFYFVPEDGDEEEHPNTFPIHGGDGITLQDIRNAFPLQGAFHFRFKKQFKSTFVWLDVDKGNTTIPKFEGNIFMKVSRLAGDDIDLVTTDPPMRARSADFAQPAHVPASIPSNRSKTPQPKAGLLSKSNDVHHSGDLLGLLHAPSSSNSSSFLDDSHTTNHSSPADDFFGHGSSTSHSNDVMGIDWTTSPSQTPMVATPSPGNSFKYNNTTNGSNKSKPSASKIQMTSDLSSAAKDFTL